MNRFFAALLALLFILTVCFYSLNFIIDVEDTISESTVAEFCFIIDAGHGGEDGGTVAVDGTPEKVINLAVAQKLAFMLEEAGFAVVMVRSEDSLIGDNSLASIRQRKVSDIRARLAFTESYPNAYLVSIHQNHYTQSKYNGAQVFYSTNHPLSQFLAQSVQQSIVDFVQPQNTRKIKPTGSNIYLLYNCEIPAIMVECGFLSNEAETNNLKNEEYQNKIAFSIMKGLTENLE